MENTTTSGQDTNGKPASQGAGTAADEARRQAFERAEQVADRWAEQLSQWAFALGHNLLKYAARAREEAEDIWAEAQAIRQGQWPVEPPPEPTVPEKTASVWEEVQAIRRRHQSADSRSEGASPGHA